MTEAPKRIHDTDWDFWYVRADIVDAMLAALRDVDDSDGQRLGLVRAAIAECEGGGNG